MNARKALAQAIAEIEQSPYASEPWGWGIAWRIDSWRAALAAAPSDTPEPMPGLEERLVRWAEARERRNPTGHGKTGTELLREAVLALAALRADLAAAPSDTPEGLREALRATRAKHQGYIDGGRSSDNAMWSGAVQAIDEVLALAAGAPEGLREALRDEIAMAEQSVEKLRDLHDNWRAIIEQQDEDGGPLIENILHYLIEDVTPSAEARALASASTGETA